MPDEPIQEIDKQEPSRVEKRGGYSGLTPASEVPPPSKIPSGSRTPPSPQQSGDQASSGQADNDSE
jgi:hypothetical protein